MGRVFTIKEVRSKKVPALENFDEVGKVLVRALTADPRVISAIIYGSYAYGNNGSRSDIDVLILYPPNHHPTAVCLELQQLAAKRYVPVSFTFQDTTLAASPLTHIGPLLQKHFARVPAWGVIKSHPLEILYGGGDPRLEVESYIRQKIRRLEEAQVELHFGNPNWPFIMQKMLEAPMHVARKVVGALQLNTTADTPNEVRAVYGQIVPEAAELFDDLIIRNGNLTKALVAALKDGNQVKTYQTMLEEVQASRHLFLKFVRQNAFKLL